MADWIMVIITAVYVVATIAICKANIKSAEAAREQIEESRKQFEEENRAYITYSFIYEKRAFYGLRFTNHGKRVAKCVKIALKKEFIDSLYDSTIKNSLCKVVNNECVLGVNQSIDIYFGGKEFRENTTKLPVEGDIIYHDDMGKYNEHFIIDFNSYPPIFTVDSELEDIRKEIRNQTSELKRLNREVSILRTSLNGNNDLELDNYIDEKETTQLNVKNQKE